MDFLAAFGGGIWTLLAFLVALSIIVAVHEFGGDHTHAVFGSAHLEQGAVVHEPVHPGDLDVHGLGDVGKVGPLAHQRVEFGEFLGGEIG